MLLTFQKLTFCEGLYGENAYQYEESDARNKHSNYNQMRAYVQSSKKNYTLSTFPSGNRRNFEDSGKVLAVSVFEFYQSMAVQLYQPTLIR